VGIDFRARDTIHKVTAKFVRVFLPDVKKPYNLRAGLWFEDSVNAPVKARIIAVNEPKNIKAIVPAGLAAGTDYTLKFVTQAPGRGGGTLLKNLRNVCSDFKLTALG
jgi:hypothetical protein